MAVSVDLARLPDHQYEAKAGSEEMASLMTSADYCGLSGWYWYCNEHDAHGIADSEDEAEFVMDAHIEYHELHDGRACADRDTEVVFYRTEIEEASVAESKPKDG